MTVYVVQNQKEIDPEAGNVLRYKFNFEPAKQFGELCFLLRPSASPFDLTPVLQDLHATLQHYSDQDYLLLVGNPVLMSLATAIAADYNEGRVNMLQWNGHRQCYIPIQANGIFID